ncbi:MAG: hypothetical protein HQ511_09850, partial [Rhodospirillales bacterium]|nr:hypothetical protein [Rhodospirillales bacterium]
MRIDLFLTSLVFIVAILIWVGALIIGIMMIASGGKYMHAWHLGGRTRLLSLAPDKKTEGGEADP